MKWDINKITGILAGAGAATWGTVQFFNFNVVEYIIGMAGTIPYVKEALYGAIGISGGIVLAKELGMMK